MTNLFYIQLIASFLVGGAVIAALSFFAERANKKIAGIILSLPSTVVVSYLFVGWVTSANAISGIVPATIATAGSVQMFAIAYLYLSKIKTNKINSIMLSFGGALLSWLILSIPQALIKFDNLPLSIVIYLIAVSIGYYLLTKKNKVQPIQKIIKYSNIQILGRAIFAGFVIALAVFLSKTLNPFWGGILSSFPAAFTSTFIIIHWYYGHDMLAKIMKAVPAGSFVYIGFTIAAKWTFPAYGLILGTITAYLVSLLIFFIFLKRKKK